MDLKRKIIQIEIRPPKDDEVQGVIYALCNDGSVWWRNDKNAERWYLESSGVPQYELSDAYCDE